MMSSENNQHTSGYGKEKHERSCLLSYQINNKKSSQNKHFQ